jgi:YegS/Rv2252/BmrU family lipid kinase
MIPSDQEHKNLTGSLQDAQRKHEELLRAVEGATARLEGRKAKLRKLEAFIARLERHLAAPHEQPVLSEQGLTHAQLIFNPSSGTDDGDSATRLAEIVAALRRHGIGAHIGIKTSGKSARAMARDAVRSGWPLVVVASGDGTIEEVASQLVGSATVLGIVPNGTMNNLARSLGIPLDIENACALIGMGTVRHIDVGRVSSGDSAKGHYFLECGGIGLGALATLAGEALQKKRWRLFSKVLGRAFTATLENIRVEMDDMTLEPSTAIVTVSNAPLMGHNLLVAPEARMDDGLLDVAVYDGMGTGELIKHLKTMSDGKVERVPIYRTRRVSITCEAGLPANADDKALESERRRIEIEVLPGALSVIVGNGFALTVPVESAPLPSEKPLGEKGVCDPAEDKDARQRPDSA